MLLAVDLPVIFGLRGAIAAMATGNNILYDKEARLPVQTRPFCALDLSKNCSIAEECYLLKA